MCDVGGADESVPRRRAMSFGNWAHALGGRDGSLEGLKAVQSHAAFGVQVLRGIGSFGAERSSRGEPHLLGGGWVTESLAARLCDCKSLVDL
jgi:hypothetical protein